MSNQRRGNWKPASMSAGDSSTTNDMSLVQFFKSAKEVLQRYEHEDAAFYFEQCEDWIRSGKKLNGTDVGKILGV